MTKDLPVIHELNLDEIRLANMLKALGNPVRFSIMQYLADRQMCITGDIVDLHYSGSIHGQPASQSAARSWVN